LHLTAGRCPDRSNNKRRSRWQDEGRIVPRVSIGSWGGCRISALVVAGCQVRKLYAQGNFERYGTLTPARLDQCIVGEWKATGGMCPAVQRLVGPPLPGGRHHPDVQDGRNVHSRFRELRTVHATTADGHQLRSGTGVATGTFTTSFGQLSLMDTRTTLTVTLEVDGRLPPRRTIERLLIRVYLFCRQVENLPSDSDSQYVPQPVV